jgi:predicted oxidoreductase
MQYTVLGRTGVEVSRLCFGTMSFGGDADPEMSAKMFARCRNAGINFFDSANIYSKGRAEESNTYYAQGGLAAVVDRSDSLEHHIASSVPPSGIRRVAGLGGMPAILSHGAGVV